MLNIEYVKCSVFDFYKTIKLELFLHFIKCKKNNTKNQMYLFGSNSFYYRHENFSIKVTLSWSLLTDDLGKWFSRYTIFISTKVLHFVKNREYFVNKIKTAIPFWFFQIVKQLLYISELYFRYSFESLKFYF